MTNTTIKLLKIQSYLTRLNDLVTLSNKSGETILSKISERLIKELFDIIFDFDLENTNLNISNFPAIDLYNESSGVAIQVTSNKEANKIIDTYETFFKNKLQDKYKRLIFVVLGFKEYSQPKLKTSYSKLLKKYKTSFEVNFEEDILTLDKVYNIISNKADIDQLYKIENIFNKNFDEYKVNEDLKVYYSTLKEPFFSKVMDDDADLTLNSIYIEPYFTVHETSINKEDTTLFVENFSDYYSLKNKLSIHDLLNRRLYESPEFDNYFGLPKSRVTFILGYPGQGKTSMCAKILFDLLTVPPKKNVFYLKLRNVSDTPRLIHNPLSVICEELNNEIDSNITKDVVKNSITILDGLDELYMKNNLKADDIEIFCKNIIHECDKFKNWQIIITTRHGYIDFGRLYKQNYIALALEHLNLEQQKNWLQKYKVFHQETWLTEKYLIDIVNNRRHPQHYIAELINQPLLLYIIASLKNGIDGIQDRADIYDKLFDQIVDRKYSADGQIENLIDLTKNDLRQLLQEIAFLIFKTGKGFVTTNELLKSAEIKDLVDGNVSSNLSDTLKGVLISFYFQETKDRNIKNEGGIEFFHKSLQEYLTAEKIVETLFTNISNVDSRNKFVMKNNKEFLSLLNQLFGTQQLTHEIKKYINGILDKKDIEIKRLIEKRLNVYLEFYFEKSFLSELSDQEQPLLKICYVFYGYWSFIQSLNLEKNFIKNDQVSKQIISHLRLCVNELFTDIDLSFQKFNNCRIDNFEIGEGLMYKSEFYNCELMNCFFYDVFAKDVLFSECEMYETRLILGFESSIVFENCELIAITMSVSKYSEYAHFKGGFVDFSSFTMDKDFKTKKMKFERVIFSEKSMKSIINYINKIKISRCYVRIYQFGKYDDIPFETYIAQLSNNN